MEWEPIIGLEVHIQLNTQSKIFSGAATQYGAKPNTQACDIDLGLPGVLPSFNGEVLKKAIMFGLSIEAEIAKKSYFDRKNYFYPDLPKGYQITQFRKPTVGRGHLMIPLANGELKKINITQAHIEEDAGKSLHEDFHDMTGIDLNRAGIPLIEVVSDPDLRSPEEAVTYLKMLHALVRYLDICDGNMQQGSFRCDANVSVRPKGETKLGTRTEIKNVNSFRFVERAITYEIQRQIASLENGEKIQQVTLLYDSENNITRPMRSKENDQDYRYFPDPDLLPIVIDDDYINQIKASLPELPQQKRHRFQQDYQLSPYDATIITSQKSVADYFENVCQFIPNHPKLAANWIMGNLMAALNKAQLDIDQSPICSQQLAELLMRIADKTLSSKIAKTVFDAMWQQLGSADDIIAAQGLTQVSDQSEIEKLVAQVIADNPKQLQQYREGKDKLFAFFVGQVMKLSAGKANPQQVNDSLLRALQKPQ